MRFEVIGEGTISQQTRTYAEYRLFAALTQLPEADRIRHVRIRLRPLKLGKGCDGVACAVTVWLDGLASFRIRATGAHAYAAINGAVERITPGVAASTPDRVTA